MDLHCHPVVTDSDSRDTTTETMTPLHPNFDYRNAAKTFTYDMNLVDHWIEVMDQTIVDAGLPDDQIPKAVMTFASNLWRMSQEEYDHACERHQKLLDGCWERRTGLFLKEAISLYPEAKGLTRADIQQQVEAV